MDTTENKEEIIVQKNKKKSSKKMLGQFYTTNQEYILQGMQIPKNIENIIEPFTGNGDLIPFIEKEEHKNNVKYNIEYYDIDPKKKVLYKKIL